MHFVVDAQLPPGLVRALAAWGHTAEHVFDRFNGAKSVASIVSWPELLGSDTNFAAVHCTAPSGRAVG